MTQNDETYLLNLELALKCARPETIAALLADVNEMKAHPWRRDMSDSEVAVAAEAISAFGQGVFGTEEFVAALAEVEEARNKPTLVVVSYSSRKDEYKVKFPSGKEKWYSMIQSALRAAADHASLNRAVVEVKSTANDDDAQWAGLFLSGQRN